MKAIIIRINLIDNFDSFMLLKAQFKKKNSIQIEHN